MRHDRREFLTASAAATIAAGTSRIATGAGEDAESTAAHQRQKPAEHCIMLWLGGGACQIDTWDPKRIGDAASKPKKSGSYYPAIDTSVSGVQVGYKFHNLLSELKITQKIPSLHSALITWF